MPINRTVKKLRAHYFKMKNKAEKSKKDEKFIDRFKPRSFKTSFGKCVR